jgi:hypothetical protein
MQRKNCLKKRQESIQVITTGYCATAEIKNLHNPTWPFVLCGLALWDGQTALSFAHHLPIKTVGRKALPTLHG